MSDYYPQVLADMLRLLSYRTAKRYMELIGYERPGKSLKQIQALIESSPHKDEILEDLRRISKKRVDYMKKMKTPNTKECDKKSAVLDTSSSEDDFLAQQLKRVNEILKTEGKTTEGALASKLKRLCDAFEQKDPQKYKRISK
jgi:hypothetical protein